MQNNVRRYRNRLWKSWPSVGPQTGLLDNYWLGNPITWLIEWLTDTCMMDGLIDLLIDRLVVWWIDWLVEWLIDVVWLIDVIWLIDRLIDWLIVWLIDWLIVRLINWLIDWLIDWSVGWLIDWCIHPSMQFDGFIYWLIDWWIDSLMVNININWWVWTESHVQCQCRHTLLDRTSARKLVLGHDWANNPESISRAEWGAYPTTSRAVSVRSNNVCRQWYCWWTVRSDRPIESMLTDQHNNTELSEIHLVTD